MVGGYHGIRQEVFNKTFGADVQSDLTAISSQKSQNWNCYDGNLTKSWLPKWKKTLSGFQWFTQELQPDNGLIVMIFIIWRRCWNCISGQIATVKGTWNLRLIGWDSFPELNTKNLQNSSIFPLDTHIVPSDKWCEKYRILSIDDTAEICAPQNSSWKESQPLGPGLAETPEVPNTIMVGKSLRFPMVHNTAPNS
jgi:hypothetical protein